MEEQIKDFCQSQTAAHQDHDCGDIGSVEEQVKVAHPRTTLWSMSAPKRVGLALLLVLLPLWALVFWAVTL